MNAKTYSYLKDNNDEDKKTNNTKKCIIKRKLKFEDYKNCFDDVYRRKEYIKYKKLILKTQQRFKCERHNAFNETINNIIKQYKNA